MLKKLKQRIPLLVLLVLLGWGLWYSRPVGVETLFPDLEPELIDVFLIDHHGSKTEDRSLRLEAGTEAFDALWKELQELRFHRSPLNPIEQALPFLDGSASIGKSIQDGEINLMYIGLIQNNGTEVWRSEELKFWVDSWSYRDMSRCVELSLWMSEGGAVGQELAHRLWEQAEN